MDAKATRLRITARNLIDKRNYRMNSESISLVNAIHLYEAGKTDEAELQCRKILKAKPDYADALQLLGGILLRRKNYEEAEKVVLQAIALDGQAPEFHNDLGNIYMALDKFELAEKCFRKALDLQPTFADPMANLGALLAMRGKQKEAAGAYQKALELTPYRPEILYNFGLLLTAMSKPEQAIEHFGKALLLKPYAPEVLTGMAEAYKKLGKFDEAVAAARKAMERAPHNALPLLVLGDIYRDQDQYENAADFYRRALVINPDFADAHQRLGLTLHRQGETDEARSHLRTAIKLDPENLHTRIVNCMVQIPLVHRTTEEIAQARENYRMALEELCQIADLTNPVMLDRARNLIGSDQPFYLAYQGEDDRELQSIYGDFVVRVLSACFPDWAGKQPSPPPLKPGEPIRVGIVSGFFYRHSVWKIPVKGWVENLNREEFQLYGYYTNRINDEQTEIAKKSFYKFTENLPAQEDWLKCIADDRLHIIIFPDIGMDPVAPRLAAFRLAPVQCVSLGHPDTTGFPTIDYFLSSDLMEPENGQDHYCEKLVRLPNLSIYYEPLDTSAAPVSRAHFGLRDDIPLFICTQSLFKYLPQYDEVFPRIAIETGSCQFAFIGNHRSSTLGERFLQRLETAFLRFNLRMADYVKMVPHLDTAHYRAFNQLADVFLDSIGWSGHNTTMEALACNLPVVTMPGKLMRGRHTHAILKMMNISETEGGNMDEYVAIAARLAKEPAWREEISKKIARNRHLAYRDMGCVHGLEEFIRSAVARA